MDDEKANNENLEISASIRGNSQAFSTIMPPSPTNLSVDEEALASTLNSWSEVLLAQFQDFLFFSIILSFVAILAIQDEFGPEDWFYTIVGFEIMILFKFALVKGKDQNDKFRIIESANVILITILYCLHYKSPDIGLMWVLAPYPLVHVFAWFKMQKARANVSFAVRFA